MCEAVRPTPPSFPWYPVVLLMLVTVSEPIAVTLLFPFAPVMVASWVPENVVGVYAGLLASTYNFASFLSNVLWGRASDRFGPLPTMALMLICGAVSLVAFGCSTSIEQAYITRACGGLFAGVGTCSRSCMRDITVKSNRGRAFALIGWSWAFGMLGGPVAGGLLAQPAERLPFLRGTVFDTFPYLLPCAAATIVYAVALVCLVLLCRALPTAKEHAIAHEATTSTSATSISATSTSATASTKEAEMAPLDDYDTPSAPPNAPPPSATIEKDDVILLASGASDAPSCAAPPPSSSLDRWMGWCGLPVMLLVYVHFLLNVQVCTSYFLLPCSLFPAPCSLLPAP